MKNETRTRTNQFVCVFLYFYMCACCSLFFVDVTAALFHCPTAILRQIIAPMKIWAMPNYPKKKSAWCCCNLFNRIKLRCVCYSVRYSFFVKL